MALNTGTQSSEKFSYAPASISESFEESTDLKPSDKIHDETVLELNNRLYSVVNTKDSPAFEKYDLERNITEELLGEYLGCETVLNNGSGNTEAFEIYTYIKAPKTDYGWYPRLVLKSSTGEYLHALIGSVFNSESQSDREVLEVYGLISSDDILAIEGDNGKKVLDRDFIDSFYNGLITKEYGDNDFLGERVYSNTGIDESEKNKLYDKYANDTVGLKVMLKNGLVLPVSFTSHDIAEVNNGLYYKVDDSWLELTAIFRK